MPGLIGKVAIDKDPKAFRLDGNPAGTVLVEADDGIAAANFLRLRIVIVAPETLEAISLQLRDSFDNDVETIDLSGMIGIREIWTKIIPGNGYRLRVNGPRQADGSTLIVRDVVRDVTPVEPLSIIEPDQRIYVADILDAELLRAARATAKFVFQRGTDSYVCTAFLIGPQRMLTNQHCMEDATVCKSVVVEFDFNSGSSAPAVNQRRCSVTKALDYSLDFAVFDIDHLPPAPEIAPLVFAAASPVPGSKLVLIEHPAGEAKQVSQDDCQVKSNPVAGRGQGTDVTHSCDTLGGSSGSAVLSNDLEVVGLHHLGIGGDQLQYNRAVRIEPIVARLKELGLIPQ